MSSRWLPNSCRPHWPHLPSSLSGPTSIQARSPLHTRTHATYPRLHTRTHGTWHRATSFSLACHDPPPCSPHGPLPGHQGHRPRMSPRPLECIRVHGGPSWTWIVTSIYFLLTTSLPFLTLSRMLYVREQLRPRAMPPCRPPPRSCPFSHDDLSTSHDFSIPSHRHERFHY